jgi:hypothetical protein
MGEGEGGTILDAYTLAMSPPPKESKLGPRYWGLGIMISPNRPQGL